MEVFFLDTKKIKLIVDFSKKYKYYTVSALAKNKILLGEMTFKIGDYRNIWLYKIATIDKYQKQGIGSKLLNYLEFFANEHRIKQIEGKYFPSNGSAKSFYENRGYTIEKEGYDWVVYKYINQNYNYQKNIIVKENEDCQEF